MKTCTSCGQPIPPKRLGATMSDFKARLFDAIKRGGVNGIDTDDLYEMIFKSKSRACMKSHVWQLNELISDSGHRVVSKGGRAYRLIKIKQVD